MPSPLRLVLALAGVLPVLAVTAPAASAQTAARLEAGVGRAEITPPTGSPFGGWVRADRVGRGVHTRLEASVLALRQGDRKVALVAIDLFAAPAGLVEEVARRAASLGYGPGNVLVSASHTHAGPSGFANFSAFNTVAPSPATLGDFSTITGFVAAGTAEPKLYTFLVERIGLALRRADRDLAPAVAGWGSARLASVTRNRSLEAHLANHALTLDRGAGRPEQDPDGALHPIDPEVDVLRVDRLQRRVVRCRDGRARCRRTVRVPLGGWTQFANHGTVNPAEYPYYNQDHHGAAVRVFEREVRREGRVPASEPVLAVYGNGNEGDQSAGLDGQGPEVAERVGRAEATAMLRAWRQAGRRLRTAPRVDVRWTRVCFCGQATSNGPVADAPLLGLPFLTGSEEGRGPLFDLTGIPFEDRRTPGPNGFASQGHKIPVPLTDTTSVPQAVPLTVVRVGERAIASLPGEPTVEVGRRARAAVLSRLGAVGVRRVVLSGLANEFIGYLTTPEEFSRQHYEGGFTLYGENASVLLTERLGELAGTLAAGTPAPDPFPFDPRNGVVADGAPYPTGATSGRMLEQPVGGRRGGQLVPFAWQGGPGGFDKPLDVAFLTVQRRVDGRWRTVTDDRFIELRWLVDDAGVHRGEWIVPRGAAAGTYRILVTARGYRLTTNRFRLRG